MAVQATTIETVTVVRPLKVDSHFNFHKYNYANFFQYCSQAISMQRNCETFTLEL